MSAKILLAVAVAIAVLAAVWGCSGDEDPASATGGASCTTPAADLTGPWGVLETIDETGCGGTTDFDNYVAGVTQSGNSLSVVIRGVTYAGTICGPIVSWTGSFPDPDGGTITVTSMTLTLGGGGTTMSGQASWIWSDGVDSCTGITQLDLTRL